MIAWRSGGRLIVGLLLTWAMGSGQAPDARASETSGSTLDGRIAPCMVCHGDQGRAGRDAYYPRLAGKPAGYLLNQMHHFRQGRRHYAWMTTLLDPLPEPYLAEIAEHFAQLNPPYAAPTPATLRPEEVALGQRLVMEGDPSRELPACASCHSTHLMGLQPSIPGLLGLQRGYVIAQIGAWQAGSRRANAPDCMSTIAKKLRPNELAGIAHWLAAQPVPPLAKPAFDPARKLPLRCGGVGAE